MVASTGSFNLRRLCSAATSDMHSVPQTLYKQRWCERPREFEMNWVPALDDPMLAAFNAEKGDYQCLFPSGTLAMRFTGVVTNFTPGEVSPEGKLSASVTIKPSGAPILATVTPAP